MIAASPPGVEPETDELTLASTEPAAAPEFPDLTEPEPLMPEASLVMLALRCRIEDVSAVLEAADPLSRSLALPMLPLSLWPQPINATIQAAANKLFFIRVSFLFLFQEARR